MSNVIPLPKSRQEQAVIIRLKKMLEEAEEGNLYQVAIVGLCQDGSIMECITVMDNMYELLGGIEIMKQRVSEYVLDSQEIERW